MHRIMSKNRSPPGSSHLACLSLVKKSQRGLSKAASCPPHLCGILDAVPIRNSAVAIAQLPKTPGLHPAKQDMITLSILRYMATLEGPPPKLQPAPCVLMACTNRRCVNIRTGLAEGRCPPVVSQSMLGDKGHLYL